MNFPHDPDAVLAAWLDEGPTELPQTTRRAVLAALSTTPQLRRRVLPLRPSSWAANRPVLVIAAFVAVVAIVGGVIIAGSHAPVPQTTPFASPVRESSGPEVTAAPISSALALAPFGYRGGGTIEYTTHDAAGGDTLWTVEPSGANPRELVPGGCCGLFSPDGRLLAVAKAGVQIVGRRDPSLLGVEVLDHPATPAVAAFTIPTGCGSCALLSLNYEPDAWSPNGRYVAISMWSDADPSQAGMGIADRDFPIPWDAALIRVTGSHPDIPVAFSPDSSMLLFLRTEQTDGPSSLGSLWLLTLADGSTHQVSPPGVRLSTNGLIQAPASWSRDGLTIAFAGTDRSTGRTNLYSNGIGRTSTAHVLVPDVVGATLARYSPDGTLIAFDRAGPGGPHDVYVVRPDGGGLTNLTATFAPGVCCGQWSPDGRSLLVAGTTSDDFHNLLFIVSASGDGIWQVTRTPGVTVGFLWGQGFR